MDSNHRSHKTTDLQSVAFGRSAIFPDGLFGRSPTSFSVWKSCIGALSTTLLLSRDLVASSQCTLVPWAGIEPATQGFSVLCSTDWAIPPLARSTTPSNKHHFHGNANTFSKKIPFFCPDILAVSIFSPFYRPSLDKLSPPCYLNTVDSM